MPRKIPAGHVVMHNPVRPRTPDQKLGVRGFRAWRDLRSNVVGKIPECACGWAPHLGVHYSHLSNWWPANRAKPEQCALDHEDES
jgi:hypothetical protein